MQLNFKRVLNVNLSLLNFNVTGTVRDLIPLFLSQIVYIKSLLSVYAINSDFVF